MRRVCPGENKDGAGAGVMNEKSLAELRLEIEEIAKRLYDSIPGVSKDFSVRAGFIRRTISQFERCVLSRIEDKDA